MMRNSTQCRCSWAGNDPLYIEYHDREWGVPVYDDQKLFEFLILEGAQAGLSWITILRRRENYRRAFANFDPAAVANFSSKKLNSLLKNSGIIRNRLKIDAAVNNARCFLEVQKEFGSFSVYNWNFVNGNPIINQWRTLDHIPPFTKESEAFSNDLKQRGFKFVGPTIMYAHMQACGMVNDHLVDCFRYAQISALSHQ